MNTFSVRALQPNFSPFTTTIFYLEPSICSSASLFSQVQRIFYYDLRSCASSQVREAVPSSNTSS